MDGSSTNMNTYIDSPRATEIIKFNFNFYYFLKENYKSPKVFTFAKFKKCECGEMVG